MSFPCYGGAFTQTVENNIFSLSYRGNQFQTIKETKALDITVYLYWLL